jgi:hypothetical protein
MEMNIHGSGFLFGMESANGRQHVWGWVNHRVVMFNEAAGRMEALGTGAPAYLLLPY